MIRALIATALAGLVGCVNNAGYSASYTDPISSPWGTVVCIPGTGGVSTACESMLGELVDRGLRVVEVAYPGLTGLSCPGIQQKADTIAAMVGELWAGEQRFILAESQGAWIASRMEADAAILYSTGLHVVAVDLGGGLVVPIDIDLSCTMDAVPARVLALTGENDPVYASPIAPQLEAIAGSHGGPGYGPRGWVVILEAETIDGAGHGIDRDPAWAASHHAWGKAGNVDWLVNSL